YPPGCRARSAGRSAAAFRRLAPLPAATLHIGGRMRRFHAPGSRIGCKTASVHSYAMRLRYVPASPGFDYFQTLRDKIAPMRSTIAALLLLAAPSILGAAKNLEIYSIDVEGGQATLFVSPSGESMLVDTGWGGFNKRDADRIALAAKKAGVKKIDYL